MNDRRYPTCESIALGQDEELKRFTMGKYAWLFVRTLEGEFAVVACSLENDIPTKVHRVQVIRSRRLAEYRKTVLEALDTFEASNG